MADAIALTVARLRIARERLARGQRCAELGHAAKLFGNAAAPDLIVAAEAEMIAAARDLLLARAHLGMEIALHGKLSRRLRRALLRESRADMHTAIAMLAETE